MKKRTVYEIVESIALVVHGKKKESARVRKFVGELDIAVNDEIELRTAKECSAIRDRAALLESTLRELNHRVHSGYDFNCDPDKMTLVVGNVLKQKIA